MVTRQVQRRNGLVLTPAVAPPPTDPPAPITPPATAGPPKISCGGGVPPGPSRDEAGGAMGERLLKDIPMGLACCIMPRPIPGAPMPTLMGPRPIAGCIMPSMGLGGTGLERRPLRPSDEG